MTEEELREELRKQFQYFEVLRTELEATQAKKKTRSRLGAALNAPITLTLAGGALVAILSASIQARSALTQQDLQRSEAIRTQRLAFVERYAASMEVAIERLSTLSVFRQRIERITTEAPRNRHSDCSEEQERFSKDPTVPVTDECRRLLSKWKLQEQLRAQHEEIRKAYASGVTPNTLFAMGKGYFETPRVTLAHDAVDRSLRAIQTCTSEELTKSVIAAHQAYCEATMAMVGEATGRDVSAKCD